MIRAVAVAVTLASLPVAAQSVDEARSRFKRGTELYDEGNYRGALVEFQRAFEASPNFRLLYNIGQVYLQLQDYARAVKSFTRYLTEGGADVPASRHDEVNKEIERLVPRIGQLTVESAPGAEVLIDDESIGFAPLPAAVPANTGRHKVSVIINGKETSRVIDLGGQQKLKVVLGIEGRAAPAGAVAGEPAPSGVRASVVTTWSLTGALAITAGTMAGLAVAASGQLVQMRDSFGVTKEQLEGQAARTRNFSIAADVLTAAAVVLGGFALWVTLSGPASPTKVAVGVGPTGATLTASF
jgi:hypothetical protein